MSAKIIMLDGPDGVGKTTQLNRAADALVEKGLKVYTTRVNGGSAIGEEIRKAYLSYNDRPVETDMYLALAMAYALADDFKRLGDEFDIILVDRSPFSLMAYQSFGSGLERRKALESTRLSLAVMHPNAVVIYEAEDATLQARRDERDTSHDNFFEDQPYDYHERISEGFRYAVKEFDLAVVDANGPMDSVHAATMAVIQSVLDQTK
jgi:dTMP kinase